MRNTKIREDGVDNVLSHNFFANLYYDYRSDSKFTPYVGIGIGLARSRSGTGHSGNEPRIPRSLIEVFEGRRPQRSWDCIEPKSRGCVDV